MKNTNDPACPKCGASIPAEAPQGLCPKCVLEAAETEPGADQAKKHRSPPPGVEEIAAAFPDLEVLELIGVGGMGAVYKARQPKLGRLVALKILSQDLAESPAFSERFNREARVLALLNHPNIVTVYDFGRQEQFFFLLMEHVDGVNLRQAMQAGKFSPSEALNVVPEICKALQFAHEEDILHRDIKPENILIDAKGRVKIADFGIAKLIGKQKEDITLTTGGAVLGSPHYMAPEQLDKPNEVDHRADIYSLGVVFYEMLTGELPIGRFSPPSEKTPMDPRVDEVVMRTLENERKRRYQSASEVKTNVEAITQEAGDSREKGKPTATGLDQRSSVSSRPAATSTRWATLSAVLTGISLIVTMPLLSFIIWTLSRNLSNQSQGAGFSIFSWVIILIAFIATTPAILGFIFGCLGLRDIRTSGGGLGGLTRSMFATLTWPLLILIGLTSLGSAMGFVALFGTGLLWLISATLVTVSLGTFVVIAVWRWANCIPWGRRSHDHSHGIRDVGTVATITAVILLIPTLLVLVPWGMVTRFQTKNSRQEGRPQPTETFERVDKTPWFKGQPEIDFAVTVPAKHATTFALIRSDSLKAMADLSFKGFVITANDKPFHGRLKFGSVTDSNRPSGKPFWIFQITDSAGTTASSGGNLPGEWAFDSKEMPIELNLTTGRSRTITIAQASSKPEGKTETNETLLLQVITQHRNQPGVPEFNQTHHRVGGGTIDWMKSLQNN